ncbi:hypothetical protein [Pseudoalteromonas sp. MMG012]|uniref:hypothetical protein n=1 Tax=Pseudoalteromonas sp. MMG012 TaxID=2822686 RepID=UPI001B3A40FF|nr:hypothetical protein [Pseudoalteromonas sp. MMG012]MBQ4851938.1 hypothetical protein [Pseudoalteromonas sp. MMG012]
MILRYMFIATNVFLAACGGGSQSDSSTPAVTTPSSGQDTPPPVVEPEPVTEPVPEPSILSLENVTVPAQFDWSMYKDDEVKIKTVSTTMRPDGALAGIGGKHFMKIVALDANRNEVENPLQKSLTDRTGETRTKLKFPSEWYGVKIEVTVGNKLCSKVFSKDEITGEIEVPCDIEIPVGDGE